MVAIVSVETVLLVVLLVLVAGLLRSHAEILHRLGAPGEESDDAALPPPQAGRGLSETPAPTLTGSTPTGDAVALDFAGRSTGPTLLAFLSSGCSTCAGFWETLAERRLPPGVQTVIVTRGGERERPSKVRSLAPPGVAVVMSSQAWQDYRVPGTPYFVLVDRFVRGEGAAPTWQALGSLVSDAIAEQREAEAVGGSGGQRAQQIDELLAASGIGPDHPSLRPG
ncbi:MAG: hypothetical protein WBP81_30070 [Solirubrobacteraceae bacterium]